MKAFYLILVLLLFFLLQLVVSDRLALGPIAPDFLVLVVVFFSLYRGAVQGTILGFVVGFLQDTTNPDFLGLNALTKSIVGYVIGKTGAKTFPENTPFLFVLFSVTALGHDIVYLIFFSWPDVASALVTTFTVAIPSAVYTGLLGVLFHKLLTTFMTKVVSALGKEEQ